MQQILVNPIAAMMQGQQAAGQVGDMRRQNALRQLYEQQGAGIAQGDPQAINALAQFDPMAAAQLNQQRNALDMRREEMGMRRADFDMRRQNMASDNARQDQRLEFDRERLDMTRQQAKQAAAEHVAKMSAAERQQEIDKISNGLKGAIRFYEAGDEAGFSRYIQGLGLDPADHPFEQFPEVAARYDGVLKALKEAKDVRTGPEPADEYGRYMQEQQAAGQEPLGRIEYAQAKKGREVVYGPDGQPILERGPGSAPPKLTVDAAKNTGYLIRTQKANEILNDLEVQGTRFGQQNLDKLPLGTGNYLRDSDFQRFDQARRDFINAILRRESGAVISDSEFENGNQQYFPVPGDEDAVIEQKRANRESAIEGLRVGSGEGAAYAAQQAPKQTANDFSAMSAEDLVAVDVDGLSPEQLQAFITAAERAGQ